MNTRRDTLDSRTDVAEVRFMVLVKRSRDTQDDDVHFGNLGIVGSSFEPVPPGRFNHVVRYAHNVCTVRVEDLDLTIINVKAGHLETLFAKQKRERQAHIAHPHNADARFSGLESMLKFFC